MLFGISIRFLLTQMLSKWYDANIAQNLSILPLLIGTAESMQSQYIMTIIVVLAQNESQVTYAYICWFDSFNYLIL